MAFTDFISSSRAPGLIGMLLALAVMAGLGMLFLFAFDDRMQGGGPSIEFVISEQQTELSKLKGALADRQRDFEKQAKLVEQAKKLEDLRRSAKLATRKVDDLRKAIDVAREATIAKSNEMQNYKDDYRKFIRDSVKGQKMVRLETREGRAYENVTIREVTAIGMQITHDAGSKCVPYEQLSDEMQDQFQFDPEQKKEALVKAREEQKQRDVQEENILTATKQMQQEQQAKREATEASEAVRAIKYKETRAASLRAEIQSLQNDIQVEQTKYVSHAPQMRIQLANKMRDLATLEADLTRARMESKP